MTTMSPFLSRLAGRIAIFLAAGTLAACSVDVDQGRGGYEPRPLPDAGRMCTREYAPVCGSRGRDRQTFANACEARKSGYDVIGRGECQIRRPDVSLTDGRDRDRDRERPGWRDRNDDREEWDRDRRGRDRRYDGREDRESDIRLRLEE